MKKVLAIMISLIILTGSILVISYMKADASQKSIAEKVIRFHVIANSDSTEDQALKLKVRDNVLKYISPKLKNSKSIEESREIIKENNYEINKIAVKTIEENGYTYTVKSKLSHENFPVKTYGNITLPQGNYEAYRIIIGNGQGHNWWCVMFPPLCFTDITKGDVEVKKTDEMMKKTLSKEEYELVNDDVEKNNLVFKFKIAEKIKEACKSK
ncbi:MULTISPECIES: stage II sporulation protein R [Clostridium]|uniref:Stage II sporulation protein R n=1 Tax=Clostridium novyi (strain NT) TaxID=386415 RepID=A0Q325_CLONN|nr:MULTISPECIES: stage II sporulation protein R [Clostridium]ABK62525.1 stage II sporulation protein R [Clostridium novyi NT]KEH85454.1 peptidase [Clostridium novyi A str. 4540]KEH87038.1 peptidase [Clostridium novyi A str. NCTC 538]KEH91128.1 peptidase [Clostridium novyi A str. BKT29909]KEH91746.1 peptidase [Clostridium novyi A str. GD211209]